MISLVIHGGAWDIPDDLVPAHREGVRRALKTGWQILTRGGSAVAAVEAAIVDMENDEAFDAGRGSSVNSAGEVELDASIMDGRTLRAGAVAAVQNVVNPVTLAKTIMEESEHVLLVGMGAFRFARDHGVQTCNSDHLIIPRELERWRRIQRKGTYSVQGVLSRKAVPGDTVGAVALDRQGNLASGTSTGGVPSKHPGRVGDSPLIGCGTYADNENGAVSTAGWGEAIIKVVMAKTVADLIPRMGNDPQSASNEGLRILERRVNGLGGIIALNPAGQVGIAFNTLRMARAYMTSAMKLPIAEV